MSFGRGQLVAGHFVPGTGEAFTGVDPRSGEALPGEFHEATAAQVDEAVRAAAKAHQHWRLDDREQRARLLEAIAEGLDEHGDALTARGSAETGLPAARLTGERGRTVGQLRLFAAVVREGAYLDARIDRGQPDRSPLPRPDLRRMRVAIGPVAVFGASNFPLAFSVAGGDTASALAAGCPVVAKAHPAHPGTCELVGDIIAEAVRTVGAPAGVFSLVHGRTEAVGRALVEHPQLAAVGFTGSLGGGRALYTVAAARPRPIPVFAEMGSINPTVLLPGAVRPDPAALASALLSSLTLGVGQFCTNPGLVLMLAGDETEAFITALASAASRSDAATMLHAGIADGYAGGLESLARAGATAVDSAATAKARSGHADVRPVIWRVSATELAASPALRQECFGPSTVVAVADDPSQLVDAIVALEGQLTATVHATADDGPVVDAVLPHLEHRAGRVLFGGFPTGVEVAPAMHHGGPWPASSDARFTSVGTAAIERFVRPVCWQNAPEERLPPELHDDNPTGIPRLVDGQRQ